MDKNAHPLCTVILTALPVEYQAVRAHLADVQEETHPEGNVYEQGIFTAQKQHWEVGIVETQMGTARAAFEAGRAIEYFKPSVVLFVGIAGGIKDVKIGDVVAATKVYGYESGKASTIFQPRPEIGLSSYRMTQRAQAIARNAQWMKRIQPPPQPLPRARVAPIAAGDKVVSSTRSSLWRLLKQNYGDALAVEMEGYGFLQAVHGNSHIEALVVRGISDLIDGKSEADATGTQEIAACNASAFAFEILAQLSQDDLVHPSRAAKGSSGQPGQPPNTAAPMSKRFRLVQSLTQGMLWSHLQSWRHTYPNASEHEAAIQVIANRYGSVLAKQVQRALIQRVDQSLQPTDLLAAMLPAQQAFEERGIFWYLGGSIASSLHGMQQLAPDVDLVVDLQNQMLPSLLPCLKPYYAFDEAALQNAINQRTACSLIHLETLMKVDLIVAKQDPFDRALCERVVSYPLDERAPAVPVASVEEMILIKLRRYAQDTRSRTDGMRDDAEWNDLIGMLKVQQLTLAREILEEWATPLAIQDVLRQALMDAGREQDAAA